MVKNEFGNLEVLAWEDSLTHLHYFPILPQSNHVLVGRLFFQLFWLVGPPENTIGFLFVGVYCGGNNQEESSTAKAQGCLCTSYD